jgi:uncharacterized membrane protein YdbT with pleckstrin-like domain
LQTTFSERPAMFRSNPFGFILSVLLVPVGVGIVILLVWYLKCLSTKVELTGNDLVLTKGLLSKDRVELDVSGIRTVRVYQSFLNRIFKVGSVSVFTAGDLPEIEVAGLPDPHQLRELINQKQGA